MKHCPPVPLAALHHDAEAEQDKEVVKALFTTMPEGAFTTFVVSRSTSAEAPPLFKIRVTDGTLLFASDVVLGMKELPEDMGGGRLYHGVGPLSSADSWRVSILRGAFSTHNISFSQTRLTTLLHTHISFKRG